MNEEEIFRRIQTLLDEEADNEERAWWMSFVDPSAPEGARFLGVIVVMAKGPAHANQKTHRLGINPGGEVMFGELDQTHGIQPSGFDRLLSKEEVISAGYVDKRNYCH